MITTATTRTYIDAVVLTPALLSITCPSHEIVIGDTITKVSIPTIRYFLK